MKLFAFFLLFSISAAAFEYEAPLEDPQREELAQQIFTEVRCLVCDGESLAGSNAEFSISMRSLIRDQLREGLGYNGVITYLTSRYGSQILQEPPKTGSALWLWFSPLLMLTLGGWLIWRRRA